MITDTMKTKNILLTVSLGALSLTSFSIFTSCDGGSSGGGNTPMGQVDSITLPNNPDRASGENLGSSTNEGANQSLEDSYAKEIFDGINAQRVGNGLVPLTRNSLMDSLAAAHNATMINQANPGGVIDVNHDNVQSRANAIVADGFTSYGENTAGIRGYSSSVVPNTFLIGWINSPGHFDNIVGNFTHSGISVTVDSRDGTIYATQIFAK